MRVNPISLILSFSLVATTAQSSERTVITQSDLKKVVWHKTVMPGDMIVFDISGVLSINADGKLIDSHWQAPEIAGNHSIVIKHSNGDIKSKLTVFVLEPSSSIDKRGYLGEYRIGTYPKDRPMGFIKLEKNETNLEISPNFNIGQFLCKQQPSVWPKYVLVSENNLKRLEILLAKLNQDELTNAGSLTIMSGFRTPYYNKAIGSAKYSRHMYGDAADVYIDVLPADGNMDDINKDGKINKEDSNFIYDYSEKLYAKANVVTGGIGSYKANSAHGPFVHIDARGRKARWGR